ncbi:hypothetical protein DL771_001625 [Monosporascus sp. 5C6A]|nr:hypothetical protein DL771_001625 [Monosporascus sp. 5C6A]
MAQANLSTKGVKPIQDDDFEIWWTAINASIDKHNKKKSKQPVDIWAAVPGIIIKVTKAARLGISRHALWDDSLQGSWQTVSIFGGEVPPPRSIDPRLVFTGSVSLVNLRGLRAMAEEGTLSPEGIRAEGDHEMEESGYESPFGLGDGELLHWPKPALRGTSTSASAHQSSPTTAGGQAPCRVTPKPRYTYASVGKWHQGKEVRELNDPPPAGLVWYNRAPPTAELAVHIPQDPARAAALHAKRVKAIQRLKEEHKKRRDEEAAAATKPTNSRRTYAGETSEVVHHIPGQAPVYLPPRGWALLEMKEEKDRRLSKRQASTKPQQQTASQPPRSRLPPHLRAIEEAKQAKDFVQYLPEHPYYSLPE